MIRFSDGRQRASGRLSSVNDNSLQTGKKSAAPKISRLQLLLAEFFTRISGMLKKWYF